MFKEVLVCVDRRMIVILLLAQELWKKKFVYQCLYRKITSRIIVETIIVINPIEELFEIRVKSYI